MTQPTIVLAGAFSSFENFNHRFKRVAYPSLASAAFVVYNMLRNFLRAALIKS